MSAKELREPTFLVLTALASGRRHGYALIEEVAELSGGRVTLRPGTLYAALDRLVDEGHVRIDGEEVVAGRLRRYSCLTESGEKESRDGLESRLSDTHSVGTEHRTRGEEYRLGQVSGLVQVAFDHAGF